MKAVENSLVSVIMPVYNASAYLEEAITSILDQSYQNFEFIIINDGSKDDTVEIIKRFDDARIKLIDEKENKGYTYRLNQGIVLSEGEFIARMDADDISLRERFAKQVEFLQNNRSVVVCGTALEIIGNANYYINWVTDFDSEDLKIALLYQNGICHPSVMMRNPKHLQSGIFYNSEFEPAEDYEYWVRLSRKYKIANLPDLLIKYRAYDGQVSQQHNALQETQKVRIIKTQLADLGLNPTSAQLNIHRRIFNAAVVVSADYLPKVKEWLSILAKANQAMQQYPEPKFQERLNLLLKKNEIAFRESVKALPAMERVSLLLKQIIGWESIN
ncbi:hypothetical protein BCY91_12215 [Pelobium manganitolerans]|uniref:Glycosyltransferase 2-like domain-containing protein n=2 Tax=Pelobium manganitolerans TaxID=1842495 RepID=A0A419S1P4_9SPHI|nr:hypothetical protein BCY91_12215 [Pelobium manganitolerans]